MRTPLQRLIGMLLALGLLLGLQACGSGYSDAPSSSMHVSVSVRHGYGYGPGWGYGWGAGYRPAHPVGPPHRPGSGPRPTPY